MAGRRAHLPPVVISMRISSPAGSVSLAPMACHSLVAMISVHFAPGIKKQEQYKLKSLSHRDGDLEERNIVMIHNMFKRCSHECKEFWTKCNFGAAVEVLVLNLPEIYFDFNI